MKKLMFLFLSIFLMLTISSVSADATTASGTIISASGTVDKTPGEITASIKAKINGQKTSSGYLDVAFSGSVNTYSSACAVTKGSTTIVSITTSTDAQKCARQIATKIIGANEASVSRYIAYNTNELRKVLDDSYKIRVAKRNSIPKIDKSIIYTGGILNALNDFNDAKYTYIDYVAGKDENGVDTIDPGISSLTGSINAIKALVGATTISSTGSSYLYDILDIELAEAKKAREFKNRFNDLRDNMNYNARKALNLELGKLEISMSIFKGFRENLKKAILNKTIYDSSKAEEKLVIAFDKDTVLTNKDKRGEALRTFINKTALISENTTPNYNRSVITIKPIDLTSFDSKNTVFTRNTKNGLFEPQK